MAQVFATIFFSAAASGALAIILAMIFDNLAEVRGALGLVSVEATPLPSRVRVSRIGPVRAPARVAPPLRAAA